MTIFDYKRIYFEEITKLRGSYEKRIERERIFNDNLKKLNEISLNFDEELQKVQQSCDRLLEIVTRQKSKQPEKIPKNPLKCMDTCNASSVSEIPLTQPFIPFTNETFDLSYNATFTGPSSSISPNNNNNEIEDFTYEEEDIEEDFIDEDYLTSEDYAFAESINNTASIETFLPSCLYNSCDTSTLSSPSITSHDELDKEYHNLPQFTQPIFSLSIFSKLVISLLSYKYNINTQLSVNIFNQYRIFIWDPGISYTTLIIDSHFLDSILIL